MMKRWAFAFGILGMLVAAPASAARDTPRYTSITVFGDSLVDAGNLYIASGGALPDPSQGYFENRFTNGYDYPDLLSLELFGVPTTASLSGGTNFAYGAAQLVDTADGVPDFAAQLDSFEASTFAVDPNGLYIATFGANDVFSVLWGTMGTYTDPSAYLMAAVDQYIAGIQRLNDLGARNIFVTDFPLAGNPYTDEANGYLNAALAGLTLDADTDLFFYSLSDFNVRVLSDSAAFGLPQQRLDTTCIDEGAQATGCTGIFSFDGIHPTAAIQAAGYQDIEQQFGLSAVQAVPEPSSWALMILGFGAMGAALRHRSRAPKMVCA